MNFKSEGWIVVINYNDMAPKMFIGSEFEVAEKIARNHIKHYLERFNIPEYQDKIKEILKGEITGGNVYKFNEFMKERGVDVQIMFGRRPILDSYCGSEPG